MFLTEWADTRGGTRTHKPLRAADFKSADFASLSTRACPLIITADGPPAGVGRAA